jgi:hypothetical protein
VLFLGKIAYIIIEIARFTSQKDTNMVKKVFLGLLLTIGIVCIVEAKPLSLYEIQEATCQIFTKNSIGKPIQGSATCANEDENDYLFITNAHVVGSAQEVTLHYFSGGYRSQGLPARVHWRVFKDKTLQDLAVLRVDKQYFGNYKPRVIPIVPDGYKVQTRHTIYSAGCQNSQWPMSWVGHAENTQDWIKFQPAPAPGQSGSALLCLIKGSDGEWYTRICGVVTWTDGPASTGIGGAVPMSVYYELLKYKNNTNQAPSARVRIPVSYQMLFYKEEVSYRNEYAVNLVENNVDQPTYAVANELVQRSIWPFDNQRQPIIPPIRRPGIIIPRNEQQQPQIQPPNNSPFGNQTPPDLGGIFGEQVSPSIPQPESPIEPSDEGEQIQVAATPRGWFSYFKERDYGWLQALGLAGVLAVLATAWRKFLRKKTVTALDKLEDNLEAYFATKVGPEAAEDAREIIEAAEAMILGLVDQAAETAKQAKASVIKQQKEVIQKAMPDPALVKGANIDPAIKKEN